MVDDPRPIESPSGLVHELHPHFTLLTFCGKFATFSTGWKLRAFDVEITCKVCRKEHTWE